MCDEELRPSQVKEPEVPEAAAEGADDDKSVEELWLSKVKDPKVPEAAAEGTDDDLSNEAGADVDIETARCESEPQTPFRSSHISTEASSVSSASSEEKPASVILWAVDELNEGNGASKYRIMSLLRGKYRSDENFSKKVSIALRRGLEFGLLEKEGTRYFMSKKLRAKKGFRS